MSISMCTMAMARRISSKTTTEFFSVLRSSTRSFPFTPLLENTPNRISVPLDATAKGAEFRAAVTDHWLPALENFAPEMVFVSAGFDAHVDDEMSNVSLTDADFRWVTEQIVQVAGKSASGRIVSVLEGGYELNSLARCVEMHVRVLMGIQ